MGSPQGCSQGSPETSVDSCMGLVYLCLEEDRVKGGVAVIRGVTSFGVKETNQYLLERCPPYSRLILSSKKRCSFSISPTATRTATWRIMVRRWTPLASAIV